MVIFFFYFTFLSFTLIESNDENVARRSLEAHGWFNRYMVNCLFLKPDVIIPLSTTAIKFHGKGVVVTKVMDFNHDISHIVEVLNEMGYEMEDYSFKCNKHGYRPTVYHLTESVCGFYVPKCKKIFITSNFEDWHVTKLKFSILKMFLNPNESEKLMVINQNNYLALSINYGSTFTHLCPIVYPNHDFHRWIEFRGVHSFFTLQQINNTKDFNIVYYANDNFHPILINCHQIIFSSKGAYAECLKFSSYISYFSEDGIIFRSISNSNLPSSYNIHSVFVDRKTVFMFLRENSTMENYIYTSQIDSTKKFPPLTAIKNESNPDLINPRNLYVDKFFKGIILLETKNIPIDSFKLLISFNYGKSWTPSIMNETNWYGNYITSNNWNLEIQIYHESRSHMSAVPWLLFGQGAIYQNQRIVSNAFFISSNSGYQWRYLRTFKNSYATLDSGSFIILISNEANVRTSKDEGLVWDPLSITQVNSESTKYFGIKQISHTKAAIFGKIEGQFSIVILDIGPFYYNVQICSDNQYRVVKLFFNNKPTLMDVSYDLYHKYVGGYCVNKENMSPWPSETNSGCSVKDFNCIKGFKRQNDVCISEGSITPIVKNSRLNCSLGSLYKYKLILKKLEIPKKCSISIKNADASLKELMISDICYDRHSNIRPIWIIAQTELILTYINYNIDGKYTMSKSYPKNSMKITDLIWDEGNRAFYAVIDNQLHSYHYSRKETTRLNFQWKPMSFNIKIVQIHLDQELNNLFYLSEMGTIGIFKLKKAYYITIISGTNIQNFKIFPKSGYIFWQENDLSIWYSEIDGRYIKKIVDAQVIDYLFNENTFNIMYSLLNSTRIELKTILHHRSKNNTDTTLINVGLSKFKIIPINDHFLVYSGKQFKIFSFNGSLLYQYMFTLEGNVIGNAIAFETKKDCSSLGCEGICVKKQMHYSCLCDIRKPSKLGFCSRTKNRDESFCSASSFACNDGECISLKNVCDSKNDCIDGEDELNCPTASNDCNETSYRCPNKLCTPKNNWCVEEPKCKLNMTQECSEMCSDHSVECISSKCHYSDYACETTVEPPKRPSRAQMVLKMCKLCWFQCKDDRSIPIQQVCDGVADCDDEEDEIQSNCKCDYFCPEGTCLDSSDLCNGYRDCINGEDEENCTILLPRQLLIHILVFVTSFLLITPRSFIGEYIDLLMKFSFRRKKLKPHKKKRITFSSTPINDEPLRENES